MNVSRLFNISVDVGDMLCACDSTLVTRHIHVADQLEF